MRSNYSEELALAKNSSDRNTLNRLKDHVEASIRRTIAKNKNTPQDIINILAYDSVQNVSYIASLHPNCNVDRELGVVSHPCVICKSNTGSTRCDGCNELEIYYS